jgi:hypothetical protein
MGTVKVALVILVMVLAVQSAVQIIILQLEHHRALLVQVIVTVLLVVELVCVTMDILLQAVEVH